MTTTSPTTLASAQPTAAAAGHDATTTTPVDQPAVPPKDKPRWGKWTPEEEAYTSRLIADFTAGLLTDVENGTTMRSWLSTKLRCCPMRISKKFVGEQSIGKRMFERNETRIVEMSDVEAAKRQTDLDALRAAFNESWVREEREREEHKANGTRKRKRNRSKKAAKATNAAIATPATMPHHNATTLSKKPTPTAPTLPLLPAKAAPHISTSLHSAAASLTFLHKHHTPSMKAQSETSSSRSTPSPNKKVAVPFKKPKFQAINPHTCSPLRRPSAAPPVKPALAVAATPMVVTTSFCDSTDTGDVALDLANGGDFDCAFDFLDSEDTLDSLWLLDDCYDQDGSVVGGKEATELNSPTSVADPMSWLHHMGGFTFDNQSTAQLYESLFDPTTTCC
ncbi:hypothetical protein H310_10392 [Aphanomyces invadans]|uniref:Uncharacterized protein n=1 Tax=Aphanomyces invadans TaxID=157072 RepID=A0A024TQ89_9STRA|nr:hypothetical protein H310_10392 [Aphanomyces invadans]ETV96198.1 hypothetical protein H310_10392 [Aphanomyces invadans]|eukprot:XP_008874990.1 hypothetical protein H310_10392 [Aphanomyces invadans]